MFLVIFCDAFITEVKNASANRLSVMLYAREKKRTYCIELTDCNELIQICEHIVPYK